MSYLFNDESINYYGFDFKQATRESKEIGFNFTKNLNDVKEIGGYTYQQLSSVLGIPVYTIKHYKHLTPKEASHIRLDIPRQCFVALWADYLRNNIPHQYYIRKRRQQRQRAYKARQQANTTIRVVKGADYDD